MQAALRFIEFLEKGLKPEYAGLDPTCVEEQIV